MEKNPENNMETMIYTPQGIIRGHRDSVPAPCIWGILQATEPEASQRQVGDRGRTILHFQVLSRVNPNS